VDVGLTFKSIKRQKKKKTMMKKNANELDLFDLRLVVVVRHLYCSAHHTNHDQFGGIKVTSCPLLYTADELVSNVGVRN
jgi:hypothetical protein